LSVDPPGSGTTTGSGNYYVGDPVSINATANAGYTFVNWTDDDDGNAVVSTSSSYSFSMPAADVSYTANFSLIPIYNVIYHANTGTGSQTDTLSPYYAGVEVTVLDKGSMVKTNYHFTGWKNGGGTPYAPAATFIMPASNVILYAQWEVDTKYSVTYNGNGNTGGTAPVEDLVKTNYHFTGWDTVQSGGGDSYTGSGSETFIMPASNVILYAQWEVDTKYSVTYNGNGNTGGTAPVEGVTVTVLGQGSMVRDKYNFTGWNTAAGGTGTAYVETDTFTMPAANVVLYAQWENLDPLMSPIDVVPGQNQIRINLRDVNDNPVLGLDDMNDWVVVLFVPNSDPTILSVEYGGPALGPWDFQIRVVNIPKGTLLRNVTVTYNGYGYPIILHEAY